MLFSSLVFLYLFLPICLLLYYLFPYRLKNYLLLVASLIFFAWGGVSFSFILIFSIVFNYFIGLRIEATIKEIKGKYWLITGVSVNLLLLGVYKYSDFFVSNLNAVLGSVELAPISLPGIILPVGISFYTFHSLSYLIDIYRRKTIAQKNVLHLALYVSMFSQLIAGPIIRYSDVWKQLTERDHSLDKFASGIERFIIGLGKKVLLANTFAQVADKLFGGDIQSLGAASAWLGMLCYSLQIYCDFAGYSDMAIGLGRMFGFEFMENFNFPYQAKSVKEFWRRWHISLSTFFRDYVYIPLGGNQKGVGRVYLNLFLVFLLTGFWHGASWTFIAWGLFHGFFMIVERLGFEKLLAKLWSPLANFYTILAVMMAWVLFRADTFSMAANYWKELFQFRMTPEQLRFFWDQMSYELICSLAIAIAGALGLFNYIPQFYGRVFQTDKSISQIFAYCFKTIVVIFYTGVLLLCTIYLTAGTYNPFIYYRF